MTEELLTSDEPEEKNIPKHHPILEQIVDTLCLRTQNTDRKFFRVEAAYFLGKMAASMRATVHTKDRGDIPCNIYALALATSGSGKGYSVGLLENEFLSGFQQKFLEETFPVIAETHLWEIAMRKAARNGTDENEEYEKVSKEFHNTGSMAFTFDSGTSPAVKQLRHKLLMGKVGSINFQQDEVGSNLEGSIELMNLFLELYDQGMVKQKLTKNTAENKRGDEIQGKTPANILLFGTPSKLLNGSKTEEEFYSLLETGYARRCLFAFGHRIRAAETKSAKEIYYDLINASNTKSVNSLYHHFTSLADPTKHNWCVEVSDDVAIALLEYKIKCEEQADQLPEHEEIKKSELSHRYFKALKLAGTYAFIDEELDLSMTNLQYAINLVEESGEAFQDLLNRDKPYIKLARYLAAVGVEQTHADLHEALPFYKSTSTARNEMMSLATAWGYRQHIVIKKKFIDGIEFFQGESLKETDTNEMIVSYSDHFAYNYLNEKVPFENLPTLFDQQGFGWANHFMDKGHRSEENTQQGFNMIVLDVDEGTPLFHAHDMLSEYKFITYTTKRHTDLDHRFRIVIPTNYILYLDQDEYSEFYSNLLTWLPFSVDTQANQRARKWASHNGTQIHLNDGILLDVLPFVPRTQKNEDYMQKYSTIQNMDNLERWFAQRIATGNRNNQLAKFAFALYDTGLPYPEIEQRLLKFNSQLSNGLTEEELRTSILITVAKKFSRG